MKNTSSNYDVTIGNVQKWRGLRPWTAQNAQQWTRMRESARRYNRSPLRSQWDIYVFLRIWSQRLFQVTVIAAGVGLVWICANIAGAVFWGRVEAILQALKASH